MQPSDTIKYVDLAEMSMSGTLQPAVPVQICLKYAPPTITIVYHFENAEVDQFFHNIPLDRRMLETESVEEICNHLYMAEGYYFNPNILKRHQVSKSVSHFHSQVKRLVQKLKKRIQNHNFADGDKSPERHSIHS